MNDRTKFELVVVVLVLSACCLLLQFFVGRHSRVLAQRIVFIVKLAFSVLIAYIVSEWSGVITAELSSELKLIRYVLSALAGIIFLIFSSWSRQREIDDAGSSECLQSSDASQKQDDDVTTSNMSPDRISGTRKISESTDVKSKLNRDVSPWLINVPCDRTHVIEGRDAAVNDVICSLRANGICGICGPPGIGKTTLAVKLVHQLKKTDYDVVFWINSASAESFADNLSSIGDNIIARFSSQGRTVASSMRAARDVHIDEKVEAVKQWIRRSSEDLRILCVFDGWNKSVGSVRVNNLLPEHAVSDKKVHVLVTSTHKDLSSLTIYNSETVTLKPLDGSIVVKLLMERARKAGVNWKNKQEETEAAYGIEKIVGGVPLAVEQVTAFISRKKMKLSQYLEECHATDSGRIPVDQPIHGDQRSNLYSVYERNFMEVCQNDCAREMMGVISFCGVGHPIPLKLFSLGSTGLPDRYALKRLVASLRRHQRANTGRVHSRFYEILAGLEQYYLVSLDSDTAEFTVHPLIQRLLRLRQSEEEQRDSVGALSALLAKVFEASPSVQWQLYRALVPHVMECYRHMENLEIYDIDFLLHAGKRMTLSGHFPESCQLLDTCLKKIRTNSRERRTPQEAENLYALGMCKRRLGQLGEASRCSQLSLSIWNSLPSSRQVTKMKARTKELKAQIFLDMDEFRQAEELLREVVPIIIDHNKLEGTDSNVDVYEQSSVLGNLGRACAGQKSYDEALEKFQQAADSLHEAEYFRFHLFQARGLVAKAWKAIDMREMSEFDVAFQECLDKFSKIKESYSSKHRYYSWVCREIAKLQLARANVETLQWQKRDKFEHALDWAKKSLTDHAELYKDGHQRVAKAADVVAHCCLELAACVAESDRQRTIKLQKAAWKCLQVARKIWKDTREDLNDNSFTVVETTISRLDDMLASTKSLLDEWKTPKILNFWSLRSGSQKRSKKVGRQVSAEEAIRALDRVASGSQEMPNAGPKLHCFIVLVLIFVLLTIGVGLMLLIN